jgi:uncharacterized membrane protein (DUF4010 family)
MRYLDYYTAPDANGDTVLVGITDLETPPLTGVLAASDAALTAAAITAGHSTWDQDTVGTLPTSAGATGTLYSVAGVVHVS